MTDTTPINDKTHPRFIAGYDAGLADGYRERPGTDTRLPQDVINLVIAARELWEANNDMSEESSALDKALEAFSERVPFENQPDDEEPVAITTGLRYRPNRYDDWGQIRNADCSMFASVRRPASEEELAEHRRAGTDPYEDLARRLMSTFDTPMPAPMEYRNDAGGFVEFITEDRPFIVRDLPAPAAVLLDMETRVVIGYRVYDPDGNPPASPDPIGWWYEDKHGCILMSLDMALGRRHEAENGAQLNLLYGKPLPGTAPTPSSHVGPNVFNAEPDGWICEDEFTLEADQYDEWVAAGLEPKPFFFAALATTEGKDNG